MSHHHENKLSKSLIFELIRIVFAVILAILGLFLSEEKVGLIWNLVINLVALIVVSYDVAFEAVEKIFKEKDFFNEETLMLLATIGAFLIRLFGPDKNEFFDGVMVMILFKIGELLEDLATKKSKKAIKEAMGLRIKKAHKLINGEIKDVEPKDLVIGDEIIINLGEVIPADGRIIKGEGSLDISSLTGEFMPEVASINQEVYSGTILTSGSLVIKVSKEYEDSTVYKILKLIEEGEDSKPKGKRLADKFAKYYTPSVMLLSLLVAIIPPLCISLHDVDIWKHWVYIALNLLIISCPCAIVISIPLCYFASIGLAGRNGIIIKGGVILDSLSEIKILASDKTGTLTEGKFSIEEVSPIGISKEELLFYISLAESKSNHPIATPFKNLSLPKHDEKDISNYQEISGLGIKTNYLGNELKVGSSTFLNLKDRKEKGSGVYIHACYDGKYLGYVILSDQVKAETKSTIDSLKTNKIKTVLLTGDREANALEVANRLSIDSYEAELLPEDKLKCIKKLQEEGPVAYVGDGINDAPSLAISNVGFAMGGIGSDVAVESSDVVIMDDDLNKVAKSFKIAKICKNRMVFVIISALLVKLIILLLAIFINNFPLFAAVISDTGLTLVLVLCSTLILKSKI